MPGRGGPIPVAIPSLPLSVMNLKQTPAVKRSETLPPGTQPPNYADFAKDSTPGAPPTTVKGAAPTKHEKRAWSFSGYDSQLARELNDRKRDFNSEKEKSENSDTVRRRDKSELRVRIGNDPKKSITDQLDFSKISPTLLEGRLTYFDKKKKKSAMRGRISRFIRGPSEKDLLQGNRYRCRKGMAGFCGGILVFSVIFVLLLYGQGYFVAVKVKTTSAPKFSKGSSSDHVTGPVGNETASGNGTLSGNFTTPFPGNVTFPGNGTEIGNGTETGNMTSSGNGTTASPELEPPRTEEVKSSPQYKTKVRKPFCFIFFNLNYYSQKSNSIIVVLLK